MYTGHHVLSLFYYPSDAPPSILEIESIQDETWLLLRERVAHLCTEYQSHIDVAVPIIEYDNDRLDCIVRDIELCGSPYPLAKLPNLLNQIFSDLRDNPNNARIDIFILSRACLPRDTLTSLQTFHKVRESSVSTPSTAAKLSAYVKSQAKSTERFYDGRHPHGQPKDTTTLPIDLYCPVFARFLANLHDPTIVPPTTLVASVSTFMFASAAIFDIERERLEVVKHHLLSILGENFISTSMGRANPDGIILSEVMVTDLKAGVLLALLEGKNEKGRGGCDSGTQGQFDYREFINSEDLEVCRGRTCCPDFLVTFNGPTVEVAAAIRTDKWIVQRLHSCDFTGQDTCFFRSKSQTVARFFYSLKLVLLDLRQWYRDSLAVAPITTKDRPHPLMFPTVTSYGELKVSFAYIRQLQSHAQCTTFLARRSDTETEIVIKFDETYNETVHCLLADHGYAPKLLYYGSPYPDLHHYGSCKMVIIEYSTLPNLHDTQRLTQAAYDKLSSAIALLHSNNYVHGDLRTPNVLTSGSDIHIIDFDWAGIAGEVTYPPYLDKSKQGKWAPGVDDFGSIQKEHDDYMLVHHFQSLIDKEGEPAEA
ncbi:hypothetical protein QCA50_014172 [Cerrena zonata]|uniref:non-specific serine/threonine protein kinase n=1 Tax=Cerrena zonata TaxID=2478898 RepID=A0AAW0FYS5_9APHY